MCSDYDDDDDDDDADDDDDDGDDDDDDADDGDDSDDDDDDEDDDFGERKRILYDKMQFTHSLVKTSGKMFTFSCFLSLLEFPVTCCEEANKHIFLNKASLYLGESTYSYFVDKL